MAEYMIHALKGNPEGGQTVVSDANPLPTTGNLAAAGYASVPTITISASPNYDAADIAGGIISLTTVNNSTGRPVKLTSMTLTDDGNQGPALTFMFFKATPAAGTYTDNEALVWGAGDLANLVGVVRVLAADWITVVSEKILNLGDIGQIMPVAATTLFMLIHVDATWNAGGTADLKITFGFEHM